MLLLANIFWTIYNWPILDWQIYSPSIVDNPPKPPLSSLLLDQPASEFMTENISSNTLFDLSVDI